MKLTAERLLHFVAYTPDTGHFTWVRPQSNRVKIGDRAGTLHKQSGYRRLMIDGCRYQEHILAWLATTGMPPDECIDHINGRRDDNRIANLRSATTKQNNENAGRRSDNQSGARGVSRYRDGRWVAQIQSGGRKHHLGYFDSIEAARAAYVVAANSLFTHHANR